MFQEPHQGTVILYTSSYCAYCVKAEQLLTHKGIPFTKIDISTSEEDRFKVMKYSAGRKTVPQIFFGEDHIGGYDDLERLSLAKALLPRLQKNHISHNQG